MNETLDVPWPKRLRLIACAFFLACLAMQGRADEGRWLLAGGHLPACSSYAESACSRVPDWPDGAFSERYYRADGKAAMRWRDAMQGELSERLIESVSAIVEKLSADHGQAMTRSDFARAFRRTTVTAGDEGGTIGGEAVLERLPDRPWYALLDFSEIPPRTDDGRRREEYVALDASESEAARAIYRRLVAMAGAGGERAPRIAVSTAASRNPYEALDYYSGLFSQAGAEVVWLPLDAAVRAAREAGDCDGLERWQGKVLGVFDRKRVAPERFELQQRFCRNPQAGAALLESVDAVFLNGGDQSLTRAAFVDDAGQATTELDVLRRRLREGALVLGGTSAGTAVQSEEVMIGNGSPGSALLLGAVQGPPPPRGCGRNASCPEGFGEDRLTWSDGGIGTFPRAVLDTHFTERWRQVRLMQLLAQTGQRFGIGIDETTALEVVRPGDGESMQLQAHGVGSVWVFDLEPAVVDSALPMNLSGLRLTRIRDAGTVRWDEEGGIAFDWPSRRSTDRATDAGCRETGLDARLPSLLAAPIEEPVCLDVALEEQVFRLVIEPVGGDSAVSHFFVSARFVSESAPVPAHEGPAGD